MRRRARERTNFPWGPGKLCIAPAVAACFNRRMTGKDKARLRGEGQRLEPAVRVGKEGTSEEVVRALARALGRTHLVKVKFAEGREAMLEQAATLAAGTRSEIVGQVGRTVLFHRPPADEGDESEGVEPTDS